MKRIFCRGAKGVFLIASLCVAALAGCKSVQPTPTTMRPVFYPFPPDPPRVQFLTAINNARAVIPPQKPHFLDFVLGAQPDILQSTLAFLVKPYGVAVWHGRIYVCDYAAGKVKVFDLERKKFYILGGDTPPTTAPTNLCVAADGYKFIVESEPALIQVFDPNDNYAATFSVKEQGRPGGVAAVGAELFVTDVAHDRILVLDRGTGKLLRTFGSRGQAPGQFLLPNDIVADADGNLYVSDGLNFRFQKLDRNGKSLLSVGGPGDTYGKFARPRGIAVGPDGVIYVVDSVYNVTQMFNQDGRVLMAFGNFQGAPGFLLLPASIAVDTSCLKYFAPYVDPRFEPEYLLFVTSQVGDARLGVYAFGHLKPGAEIPPLPAPETPSKSAPQTPAKPATEPPAKPAPETAPAAAGTQPSGKP